MNATVKEFIIAIRGYLVLTLICCVAYPLAVYAAANALFRDKAEGSLVDRAGVIVGSELIGQNFTGATYFQPRPSAAGSGYDGMASSGSNYGPSAPQLLEALQARVAAYRELNAVPEGVLIPSDAVMASGSGLDPDISIANALLQSDRVAKARGLEATFVRELVQAHVQGRDLGFLGEPRVNVFRLNLSLDEAS